MYPRTSSLFHFTSNLATLKSIIESKQFLPSFCLEDQSWLFPNNSLMAYPVVCFCDIPLARLKPHTDFYGSFGLGMSQPWAIKNGLTPVAYVSHSSPYKKALSSIIPKDNDPENLPAGILGFTKPFRGTMLRRGGWLRKDFYPECEWRFLANSRTNKKLNLLLEKEFSDVQLRGKANRDIRTEKQLKFDLNDIKYILVQEDSAIPELIDFMMVTLKNEKQGDVQILMTRILSLESIGEIV